MNINSKVELIFSQAVALDQAGRMKNTIYCNKDKVYILNTDKTILLHFKLPAPAFDSPLCFSANDYDSSTVSVEKDKVVFHSQGDEFDRKKSCSPPENTFADIEKLFKGLVQPIEKAPRIVLSSSIVSLLEENLSHIEFHAQEKQLVILQKDIYSGNTIQLERKKGGLLSSSNEDKIPKNFAPIGIRTGDFFSLFSFNNKISFYVFNGYCYIEGADNSLKGFLGCCLYDELAAINYITNKGGKK